MEPICLGIVGAGAFTRGSHLPVIGSLPGIRVSALCDTDGASLRQAVDLVASQVKTCSDYRDLVGMPGLDAVLVATPTNLHAEIAVAAFAAGKHVFCEKPLTPRPQGLAPLLAAWRSSGRLFQVGYVYRYAPIFRRMRVWIERGDLGRPLMMWAHEFRAAFYTPWRYDVEISGGTMVEKCCHHFDLFHWMLGAPVMSITGFGGQAVIRSGAEVETIIGTTLRVPESHNLDHAWVLTEHGNATHASLGLSMFAPHGPYGKTDADLESLDVGVIGDKGKLVAYVRQNELRFWPRDGGGVHVERIEPAAGLPQGWHAGGREQWEEFIACIQSGRPPSCDGILGVQGLLPAFAAERAIDERRMVSLDEIAGEAGVSWPEIL
jgi:predicted dehydrogenase